MSDYAVEMLHITKRFPGITANDDITLRLKKGEIHALLGENGAGKSVLMSILFGLYQADEGEIYCYGKKAQIKNPNDANRLGIGMVHQHFQLVECFSVLDNIILGAETVRSGLLQKDEARERVMELSERYHLQVEPDALISDITVGMQQRTEILKMLYREADILIFDEPTAVLTVQDTAELMKIMKRLAAEGRSILFISHKLNEIMEVADCCTVIRKGKYIGTVATKDTTPQELAAMMVGRVVNFQVDKKPATPGEKVLEVCGLTLPGARGQRDLVHDVSFSVRRGEIVGIAGVDGNGQSELIYAIAGIMPFRKGTILLNGHDVSRASVRERSAGGMSHIPADRHKYGMVLDYTLEDNLILQRYFMPEFTGKSGIIKREASRRFAQRLIDEYDIRSGQGAETIARTMSGGNQQKAVIARELEKNPDFIIAVQPTRGVDIGAVKFIHKTLIAERDKGKGVLLVSFELDEIMDIPDRILVMHNGEITGEFRQGKVTIGELGLYMTGAKRQVEKKDA